MSLIAFVERARRGTSRQSSAEALGLLVLITL
jgi:hypothetical protein